MQYNTMYTILYTMETVWKQFVSFTFVLDIQFNSLVSHHTGFIRFSKALLPPDKVLALLSHCQCSTQIQHCSQPGS